MICGTVPSSVHAAPSDGSDVIAGGSAFQTFAAATGKARWSRTERSAGAALN